MITAILTRKVPSSGSPAIARLRPSKDAVSAPYRGAVQALVRLALARQRLAGGAIAQALDAAHLLLRALDETVERAGVEARLVPEIKDDVLRLPSRA